MHNLGDTMHNRLVELREQVVPRGGTRRFGAPQPFSSQNDVEASQDVSAPSELALKMHLLNNNEDANASWHLCTALCVQCTHSND